MPVAMDPDFAVGKLQQSSGSLPPGSMSPRACTIPRVVSALTEHDSCRPSIAGSFDMVARPGAVRVSQRVRQKQRRAMRDYVCAMAEGMDAESVRQKVRQLRADGTLEADLAPRLQQEISAEAAARGAPLLRVAFDAYDSKGADGRPDGVLDLEESINFFGDYAEMQLRYVPERLAALQLLLSGMSPESREGEQRLREMQQELLVTMAGSAARTRAQWFAFVDADGDGRLQFAEVEAALIGHRAEDFARLTYNSLDTNDGSRASQSSGTQVFALVSGFSGNFSGAALAHLGAVGRCALGCGQVVFLVAGFALFALICGGWMAVWLCHAAWSEYPSDPNPTGDCPMFRWWAWVMAGTCVAAALLVALGVTAVQLLRINAGKHFFRVAAPVPLFAGGWLLYGEYLDKYGSLDSCQHMHDNVQFFLMTIEVLAVCGIALGCYVALRVTRVSRGGHASVMRLSASHSEEYRIARLQALCDQHAAVRREAMERIVSHSPLEQIALAVKDNCVADGVEAALVEHCQRAVGDVAQSVLGMKWDEWPAIGQLVPDPDQPGATCRLRYGDALRRVHYELPACYLNSASYGATPRAVLQARQIRETEFQRNPVYWRFTTLGPRMEEAKSRLARFIGTDASYVTLLPNANAATSAVLRSLPWRVGDRVLIFSVEYMATGLACAFLKETYGVEVVEVELNPPMTDKEVVASVREALDRMSEQPGGLPRVANFCHVTSATAWIFPAKKLVNLFHDYGVSVMVDGAQAAGHLPDLSVRDIQADWYIGTVHKWMFSCPGVAFLVTQPHKQECTSPLTVSYFHGEGYEKEFSYTGLQDWSVLLTACDGLDFAERVCGGWDVIHRYRHDLAEETIRTLAERWSMLPGPWWLQDWHAPVQGRGRYGAMPMLALPWAHKEDATAADAQRVMGILMSADITAFLLACPVRGKDGTVHRTLCVRCSCNVFNCAQDWRRFADRVADLGGAYTSLQAVQTVAAELLSV